MSDSTNAATTVENSVPLQPVSLDIWDKKYRLTTKNGEAVDADLNATLTRTAKALADVEKPGKRKVWNDKFVWAMQNGAIPAGRILSNAGAGDIKPETSLINCTVSGIVRDSMDDILGKVHEAGLTLKAGCGIGYEFSTLRPKGAFVAGAGAYTSGPLSFMDIYDKMCFTVSSAGGRRGAQMATFDIQHPDVTDFVKAKREDGRLRQFNLSLLITDQFMDAVKTDSEWKLVFPISKKEQVLELHDLTDSSKIVWREWPVTEGYVTNDTGLVACMVYRTMKATQLWNVIMASTYDFAEPGFILIDHVNEMNNNWFCENIRATNPCVTGDTRLHTSRGMVRMDDLHRSGEALQVAVDNRALEGGKGSSVRSAVPVFMTDANADIYKVVTKQGYEIKATEWHDFYTGRGKLKLKDIVVGDNLQIHSGKGVFGTMGSKELGMVTGFITGDGHISNNGKDDEAVMLFYGAKKAHANMMASIVTTLISGKSKNHREYAIAVTDIPSRDCAQVSSTILARELSTLGFTQKTKLSVPEVVWQGTEECVKGYLSALFTADGTVNISEKSNSCSVRLASSYEQLLKDVQVLLSNFGIMCSVMKRRDARMKMMPDGEGGEKSYPCQADYELIIDGESRNLFSTEIGFLDNSAKSEKLEHYMSGKAFRKTQRFESEIISIEYCGKEAVYDTTQADHNAVVFNGLSTGQCGEQPLPPYGSCLLGSVNLTSYVRNPFTAKAYFDWATYREVVAVFTRMLDNVVELNGLPLPQQREEITSKRRHGMGYLGLGSALAMMQVRYDSPEAVSFTEQVSREMAFEGLKAGLDLAKEKGPAPIMKQVFIVTAEMLRKRPEMAAEYKVGDKVTGRVLWAKYSRYMQRVAGYSAEMTDVVNAMAQIGCRFTHHTSIAPTGTISLSFGNNASNGIEPSFAHHYARNVIREGKKSKEKVDVFSYELLAYRAYINPNAMPFPENDAEKLPSYFADSSTIPAKAHVDIQAAAQLWIDSSISKTINVPTDYPFDDFKDIYQYAYDKGLKGCTTFRFNPAAFQGVLVTEKDLENTLYKFTLEDGSTIEVKGNEEIEYDGEMHSAANLYDALKEGYYGKF